MSEKVKTNADYSSITECPGQKATQEQLDRIYHRYHFVKQFSAGSEILEVGCGSGLGLGYLAKDAIRVVGGDIDAENVRIAKEHYKDNHKIAIDLIDAHHLPFEDSSFDLVIMYEAIYYLENPIRFISEAKRILKKNGHLIICSVNKDWEDFHPSKHSFRYFSAPELYELLISDYERVELYGAFETGGTGAKSKIFSILKRVASRLNMIPGSLKARAYLKRIFIGKLYPIPEEVYEGMADYREPVPLSNKYPNHDFKVIYAAASKTVDK